MLGKSHEHSLILLVLITAWIVFSFPAAVQAQAHSQPVYCRGRVIRVQDDEARDAASPLRHEVTVVLVTGPQQGQEVMIENLYFPDDYDLSLYLQDPGCNVNRESLGGGTGETVLGTQNARPVSKRASPADEL